MGITLYNTLSRRKELLTPRDPARVGMYVCGPTVYDRAHLGNARSVVAYDALYRLLRHEYGAQQVRYVRNITDVDDKINEAAKREAIPIHVLTERVTGWFHADMGALGVMPADGQHFLEPRATQHIPQMIVMITQLLHAGAAYAAEGHVLFSVASAPDYGALSGRVQEELQSGARVKVEGYKRAASDFVLWKPALAEDDPSSVFDSPWGPGRPGWHIECSAMSTNYLGADFDIHGGGADLMFPHHENEIAQSRAAHPGSHYATLWVHNGFLTVNGEKMSKSLGNFITVQSLLAQGVRGEVIRYALLKTKYREPLDWTEKLVADAKKELDALYRKAAPTHSDTLPAPFLAALHDDMNIPLALSLLYSAPPEHIRPMAALLGFMRHDKEEWFQGEAVTGPTPAEIETHINARRQAKAEKRWEDADAIRHALETQGILLEDGLGGITHWRRA